MVYGRKFEWCVKTNCSTKKKELNFFSDGNSKEIYTCTSREEPIIKMSPEKKFFERIL